MVVKVVSEEGVRLNIRKATLREWRREFARHLRAQGISANATDKAVRGATRPRSSDGMYRAMQRGASEASSKESLLHTRAQVERGWLAAAQILDRGLPRPASFAGARVALRAVVGATALIALRVRELQLDQVRVPALPVG